MVPTPGNSWTKVAYVAAWTHLRPNYAMQRSALVGTPLAATGAAADRGR